MTILSSAKQILLKSLSRRRVEDGVTKGHFAVYIGESTRSRFLVPISYLKQPLFEELLRRAEEEYGFVYPLGGLTIPCSEDAFFSVTSHLKNHYYCTRCKESNSVQLGQYMGTRSR